jgi:hypothetical protein
MLDRRYRISPIPTDRTAPAVPADQARALDRRQCLDQQQRTFRAAGPGPHVLRPRPPG